jgi:predicted Ser/Thr protein kinase
MTDAKLCPECGAQIPAGSPGGMCPQCLLKAGLAGGGGAGTVGSTAASPGSSGFIPPAPDELARHFPQLEVLELLGRGGMGAVYKARQPGVERLVALKILPPEVGRDPAFAERFTREARALAHLNHPNIVTLYEFGQRDGMYYFVMEFVDGLNVRQLLESRTIAPEQALAIVPQVCEALQFAHDEGIVHRDIKPENILLDKKGRVKIADFGLAKLLAQDPADLTLTGTHQVMGTLRYMAPEQMEGSRAVDHRADIYSLGVVFYELLTGEVPMGRFAPPSKKVEVDVRLDEVVLRALEREPEQRYQHVSQVISQLEAIRTSPARPATSSAPQASDLESQVLALLPGRTVEAIKLYRERTGSGLADAARAIERIAAEHGVAVAGPQVTWRHYVKAFIVMAGLVALMQAIQWDVSPALIGAGFLAFTGVFAAEAIRFRGTPTGWRNLLLLLANLLFVCLFLTVRHEPALAALYRVTGGDPGRHDRLLVIVVCLGQLLWIVPTMIRLGLRLKQVQTIPVEPASGEQRARQAWWRYRRSPHGTSVAAFFVTGCLAVTTIAQLASGEPPSWWLIFAACYFFGLGLMNLRRAPDAPAVAAK